MCNFFKFQFCHIKNFFFGLIPFFKYSIPIQLFELDFNIGFKKQNPTQLGFQFYVGIQFLTSNQLEVGLKCVLF